MIADMKLTRQYFDVKNVVFGEKCAYDRDNGLLTVNEQELIDMCKDDLFTSIKGFKLEITKPNEDCRIIHVLDTLCPMYKIDGGFDGDHDGQQYSGYFSTPFACGRGVTNMYRNFSIIESAAIPWQEENVFLYPRDAIIELDGEFAGYTPFHDMYNLVIVYDMVDGKTSEEYDNDIRLIAIRISNYLASLTAELVPDDTEVFSLEEENPDLPGVVFVWHSQNQGTFSNTHLYGVEISNMVPTILHPNEMLDGCVVSGNFVWPAFKVCTYLYCNHPIIMELYKRHGKDINFKGVIFARSHQPSTWHKHRQAQMNIKLAQTLGADGLVMAWEGGGNACVDGMLTIQHAEKVGIKCSTVTFEFGGTDGTEGLLLVADDPAADCVISGGSIERSMTLQPRKRAVGGPCFRLNKESGGRFPSSTDEVVELENRTHMYLSGNQCAYSKMTAEAY